ncbi:MAG: hypothetical protein ACRDRL_11460 [Sciscionella sp.]
MAVSFCLRLLMLGDLPLVGRAGLRGVLGLGLTLGLGHRQTQQGLAELPNVHLATANTPHRVSVLLVSYSLVLTFSLIRRHEVTSFRTYLASYLPDTPQEYIGSTYC